MNITLRQIEAFLAVAALGNYTRAARQLRIAQPTLSLLIRDLETNLKVRVLDRTTRRVELTAAGEAFRRAVEAIPMAVGRAIQDTADVYNGRQGRIVVAAPPLLAAALLPQAIAKFREVNPAVDVGIIDGRTEVILQKIRSREADCAVGTFSPKEDGIIQTRIARDQLLLFCHQSSDYARKRFLEWKQLEQQPVITLTRDSGVRMLIDTGFESAGITLNPAFEVTQITTAISLVAAGLGVAVLPTYAWSFAQYQNVTARPLRAPSIMRDISIITSDDRSVSPLINTFANIIRQHVRPSSNGVEGAVPAT